MKFEPFGTIPSYSVNYTFRVYIMAQAFYVVNENVSCTIRKSRVYHLVITDWNSCFRLLGPIHPQSSPRISTKNDGIGSCTV